MGKSTRKSHKRDDVAAIVAEMHGVTPQYVRLVRKGDRKNEEILATLVEFRYAKNKLIKHLEKLVPIKQTVKKSSHA